MISEFTAIILSGGRSSRMGEDKSLLEINGITIIERIHNLLCGIFGEVLIIMNDKEKYEKYSFNIAKDIYPGFGPLSGIHSGLINSNSDNNFFISCDMPFINYELIKYIISRNSEHDVILPRSNDTIHSLCGIYKKKCLGKATELLKEANDNYKNEKDKTNIKLFDLLNSVDTKYVELNNQKFYSKKLTYNMNTHEDYIYVKSVMESNNNDSKEND